MWVWLSSAVVAHGDGAAAGVLSMAVVASSTGNIDGSPIGRRSSRSAAPLVTRGDARTTVASPLQTRPRLCSSRATRLKSSSSRTAAISVWSRPELHEGPTGKPALVLQEREG